MAKSAPIQNAFNAGELSPLMAGRVDFDKEKTGLKVCLNHIPLVQGPVTRRPGTYFVHEVKNSNARVRLVRFEFSITQAYVLEFGNLYIRIYANHGRVENPPGTPIEVVTPYTTAELQNLQLIQSADVLYITANGYAPRKLQRASAISWSLDVISFNDGPYLKTNSEATTFALSATGTGNKTLTASSVTGVNDGLGFLASDVGRPIRVQVPTFAPAWGTIGAWTDSLNVTVDMHNDAGATTATTNWRMGAFSVHTGYPAAVTFYQDRLGWAGTISHPDTVYFSVTGGYEDHAPTAIDTAATVSDDNALNFTLNSRDVSRICWMSGDANGLLVGTVAGEWVVSPSTLNEALTPTNINAKEVSTYGSSIVSVPGVRVGYSTLMLQRSTRKIRELSFLYYENKFKAPDMTVVAQHITRGGITELAFQQEPQSILWCVRADGVLLGFTYERDQNVIAWHRHKLGPVDDATVESIATIPAPSGKADELWMVVRRTVGGATHRYVEYMTPIWEHGDDVEDAIYVDAALTYDGAPATTISGLLHLEGATVTILADGAVHPQKVVSGGAITLDRAASKVQVGMGYDSDGQTNRNDAGAADGTAQGKTQRAHRVTFRVIDTGGLTAGPDFDHLTPYTTRTGADSLGAATPLYTGDLSETWEGDYSSNSLISWRFSGPLPGTIAAIMPQQFTMDR